VTVWRLPWPLSPCGGGSLSLSILEMAEQMVLTPGVGGIAGVGAGSYGWLNVAALEHGGGVDPHWGPRALHAQGGACRRPSAPAAWKLDPARAPVCCVLPTELPLCLECGSSGTLPPREWCTGASPRCSYSEVLPGSVVRCSGLQEVLEREVEFLALWTIPFGGNTGEKVKHMSSSSLPVRASGEAHVPSAGRITAACYQGNRPVGEVLRMLPIRICLLVASWKGIGRDCGLKIF